MQEYFSIKGYIPDDSEGNLCRWGFPPSSRHTRILPNAQRVENSNKTTYTMAEPSRDGGTTVREISLGTRGHGYKESGQTTLAQITPAQYELVRGFCDSYGRLYQREKKKRSLEERRGAISVLRAHVPQKPP